MIPLRDSHPSERVPLVTFAIIAINVLIFLYQSSLDEFSADAFIHQWAVVPGHLDYVTLITSMFLHGSWMHLIGNMWFLWIFGDNIEDILGSFQYLLFYIACGVLAAFAQLPFSFGSDIPILGASGAIAGVMGAYMVKFPKASITTLIPIGFLFVREIPAIWMLGYWMALQIISGLFDLGREMNTGGVAFFAHVGGFLAGVVLIKVMKTNEIYFTRPQHRW